MTNDYSQFRITRFFRSNSLISQFLDRDPRFRVTTQSIRKSFNEGSCLKEKKYTKQFFTTPREPWEDFGWKNVRPGVYMGQYHVRNESWQGKAIFPAQRNAGALFDLYCKNPPSELNSYEHRACWHHVGNGWYWIHFNVSPKDIGSGIRHIENSIAEMKGGFGS